MRKKLMAILLSVAVISMYTFGSVGSIFAEDASTDAGTQTESTQTTDTTEATDSTSTGTTEDTTAESEDSTQDTTVSYPEQSFSDSVGGTDISVSAPEGAFPEGTTMKATAVSSSDVQTAIDKAAGSEVKNLQAIDITFYDKDGNKVEPKKNVDVKFSSVDLNGENGLNVYHMNSDNSSADKVAESDSSDSASLSTGSFSIYVITDGQPAVKTYVFHNEDGTELSKQAVKTGDKLVEPKTPTKEGYKFLGWATKGSSDYFTSFGTQTVKDTTEVDLYSQFQQAYYVYFMDGTTDDSRVIFTKEGVTNDVINTDGVIVPLASNMSVTGWYTDAELTNKVTSVTLKDSNVKLYPKVEEGNYLTFDANGGSYTEPEFVSKSSVTAAPTNPKRAGYTFDHWEYNGKKFEFGMGIIADTTVKAVWKADKDKTKYTVIHWQENADDKEYSYKESETVNGTAGEKTAVVANEYDGFKTAKTITQQTINGDGSTIVNVYYDRETYSVKFYKWTKVEDHWYGDDYDWVVIDGITITAKYGENIKDKWPTSTATNWLVEPNGDTYQSGISTMPLGGADFYYVDQNGKYTIKTYYYTETLDGKTYKLDHTDSFKSSHTNWYTTKEDHYDIDGFTYTKNLDDHSYYHQEGNSKTYSVTFYYSRNSYNVKFINKGSVDKTETNKYQADISGLSYTPERPSNVPEGYTFAGWYDNENCEGEAYSFTGKTMPSHNITLYAKWAAPTYTAKAHLDLVDSGSTELKSLTVGYGSKINKSDMPTVVDSTGKVLSQGDDEKKVTVPDGYKWLGWSTYSNGEYKLYNFDTEVYADKDLYPNYISEAKYKVSYDLNSDSASGTVPTDLMNYASGSYAEVASGLTITAPAGEVFLNWNTSKDGNGDTSYPKDKIQIKGDTTLYAQYGPIESVISLTYHANYPDGIEVSGSTVNTVNSLKNNEKVALLENMFTEATSDYVFEGWNTKADGSGTTYAVGSEVYIDNDTTQGTNDLYAKWVKKAEINVVITGNTDSIVYDGKSHSVEGYTINANDLPEGVSVSLNASSKAIATGTNAGTYNMNLTKDDFTISGADKYKVNWTVNDGKLTINKKALEITVTGNNAEKTYTGEEQSVEGYKTSELPSGVSIDLASGSKAKATGKDAGTYNMNLTKSDFVVSGADNYDVTLKVVNGKLTINKKALEITVTGNNAEKTYTGEEQSVEGYKTSELPSGVSIDLASGKTAKVSGTNAGTYDMNLTKEYFVVSGADNYDVTLKVVDGKLTINEKALEITVTGNNAEKTYNGEEQSVEGYKTSELPSGVSIDLASGSKAKATGKDAGTYNMNLTKSDFVVRGADNYDVTLKVVDGKLTINKKALEITVTGNSATKTYTGKEQSVEGFSTSTLPENVKVDLASGKTAKVSGTNAGTYDMNLTKEYFVVSGADNYDVTLKVVDGKLTINKKALEITVTGNSATKTYTGKEQSVEGFSTSTLPENVKVDLASGKTAKVSGTNAGTYDMNLTKEYFVVSGADNYDVTLKVVDGKLTINKKALEITVTGNSATKTYTGKEQSVEGFSTSTLPENVKVDLASGKTAKVSGTNAGTYDMNLTKEYFVVSGADNYDVTLKVVDGKLTINEKALEITVTGNNAEKTYNGEEQSVEGYKTSELPSGVSIDLASGSKAKATGKDAGTYNMNLTKSDFVVRGADNYDVTLKVVDGKLTINKKALEITVTGNSATKTYTGKEQSVEGFSTSTLPENVKVDLASGKTAKVSGTNAGTYDMNLTKEYFVVSGADNYDVTLKVVDGKLTINKKALEITVTGNSATKTYTGKEQSVEGFSTSTLPENVKVDLASGKTAKVSGTNAGTYDMNLTKNDFEATGENAKNYDVDITVVDGYLVITPVPYVPPVVQDTTYNVVANYYTSKDQGKTYTQDNTSTVEVKTATTVKVGDALTVTPEDAWTMYDGNKYFIDAEKSEMTKTAVLDAASNTLTLNYYRNTGSDDNDGDNNNKDDGDNNNGGNGGNGSNSANPSNNNSAGPDTGDSNDLGFWAGICGASGVLLAGLYFGMRRRENSDSESEK